jgi:hypothetical protein
MDALWNVRFEGHNVAEVVHDVRFGPDPKSERNAVAESSAPPEPR